MKNQINWYLWALAWILVNLFQAYFTPFANDEAYYWVFSRRLDWGYFDHPPLVALYIYLGSFIPGNIGLRLISIISQALTLRLIWQSIDNQEKYKYTSTFFLIAFAIPIFNLFGFISTPDSPLLLSVSLFILAYKKFISKPYSINILFLGFAMALMLYSKYHGLLVIVSVMIANWKLLFNKHFYLASIFGAFVFMPHIIWQFQNHFPTLEYHLISRSGKFRWFNLYEYLYNLVLVLNPFLLYFIAVYHKSWKHNDVFKQSLFTIIWFFLVFFLFMPLRSHVQPQWLVVVSIPLIIMLFEIRLNHPEKKKLFNSFVFISIIILITIRLVIITGVFKISSLVQKPDAWKAKIDTICKGRIPLFNNSYAEASRYAYISGNDSINSNHTFGLRSSQYDFWSNEIMYHNKNICLFSRFQSGERSMKIAGTNYYALNIDSFQAISKIRPVTEPIPDLLNIGDTVHLGITITNPYPYDIQFGKSFKTYLVIIVQETKKKRNEYPIMELNQLFKSMDTIRISTHFPIAISPGRYKIGVSLKFQGMSPYRPGNMFSIQVEQ